MDDYDSFVCQSYWYRVFGLFNNQVKEFKMKTKFIAILIVVLLVGCSGLQIDKDLSVIYSIENAAVVLGYYAAQEDGVDLALRSIYDLSVHEKLQPENVNQILSHLDVSNPLQRIIIQRILRLAELVGASVIDGKIVDITGIPSEFVNAIARGHVEGYQTFMLYGEGCPITGHAFASKALQKFAEAKMPRVP